MLLSKNRLNYSIAFEAYISHQLLLNNYHCLHQFLKEQEIEPMLDHIVYSLDIIAQVILYRLNPQDQDQLQF